MERQNSLTLECKFKVNACSVIVYDSATDIQYYGCNVIHSDNIHLGIYQAINKHYDIVASGTDFNDNITDIRRGCYQYKYENDVLKSVDLLFQYYSEKFLIRIDMKPLQDKTKNKDDIRADSKPPDIRVDLKEYANILRTQFNDADITVEKILWGVIVTLIGMIIVMIRDFPKK